MRPYPYSVIIENHVMLLDHIFSSPYAERPEGPHKLSLVLAQTFFAQTFGTVHTISVETTFLEIMRVFEELYGDLNHLFQIARR
jgi:hypothetical protein